MLPSRPIGHRIAAIAAACLVVAACGPNRVDVATYFDGLADAYSADDVYSVLDFYGPGATIEHRTGEYGERVLAVAQFLSLSRGDLAREVLGIHTDKDGAIVFISRSVAHDLEAVLTEVTPDGAITHETLLVSLDSLQRGAHVSPEVADRYRELVDTLAEGEASIDESWQPLDLTEVSGSGNGPALFLDPLGYGDDPHRALSVYDVTIGTCTETVSVYWSVDTAGTATAERTFTDPATSCSEDPGWWTGLATPPPRDQLVTGSVAVGDRTVSIHNGTETLEDLVVWGFSRFAAAGLPPPRIESVTFQPSRRCDGLAGRVIDVETGRDLYACVYEYELCPRSPECVDIPPAIRFGLLHELGHAWLEDHTTTETRTALLTTSGRTTWNDPQHAWADRGAEYAAEMIAWGLMDHSLPLVRIGSPECSEAESAFRLLTGVAPIPTCPGAP